MKLAIPINKQNEVDGHFGHCEMYKVLTFNETNELIDSELVDSPKGCGCKSDIAQTLAQKGVTVMLTGGIGTGAVDKLATAGITVVRGCSGNVDELALNYAKGDIVDTGTNCNHHDHHHQGSCNH